LAMQAAVMPWRYATNGSLLDDPGYWWIDVMGRLKPGVTDAAAQAAAQRTLEQAVRASLPGKMGLAQPHLRLLPGARGLDNLAESFGRPLTLLLSLVGLVLLMACVNVAKIGRASCRERV